MWSNLIGILICRPSELKRSVLTVDIVIPVKGLAKGHIARVGRVVLGVVCGVIRDVIR